MATCGVGACGPVQEIGDGTEATGTTATGDPGGETADTAAPTSGSPTGPGPTSDVTSDGVTSIASDPGDTDSDSGTGSDTEAPVIDCAATPIDHAAACPDPCPLTVDLEVRCGDRLGDVAVSVAPAPDTTWLVADTFEASLLFRADALEAARLDVLPYTLASRPVHAALDPTGKLHLLGDTGDDYNKGGLTHFAETASWQPSVVFSLPGKNVIPVDFEVDADGRPHAWFKVKSDEIQQAVADGLGGWTLTPVPTLGVLQQESLTADGRHVTAAVNNGQVSIEIDGVMRDLGDPLNPNAWSRSFRLTHAPAPGELMLDPPTAVATYDSLDGLAIAWPKEDGHVSVGLPDTAGPVETCSATWNGPGTCTTGCVEKNSGVEDNAYALARTVDGTLWAAYMVTHVDRVVDFFEDCRDICECVRGTGTDKSRGELRLFRIATDGTPPKQVLALPIAAVSYPYAGRAIDLRGFGDQLALGVRIGAIEEDPRVRLFRIDTSKVAP